MNKLFKDAKNTVLSAAILAVKEAIENGEEFEGALSMNMYYNEFYKIYEATVSFCEDYNMSVLVFEGTLDEQYSKKIYDRRDDWIDVLEELTDVFGDDSYKIEVI